MNKFIAILLCIWYCSTGYGQQNYYFLKSDSSNSEDCCLSFPIFCSDKDSSTTVKINQLLQISELWLMKGFEQQDIFENITDFNRCTGHLNPAILNNSNKCLAMKFDRYSSCGCGEFYSVGYYNFNGSNGDLIELSDLFTTHGIDSFHNYVVEKKINETHVWYQEDSVYKDILEVIKNNNFYDFYIKNDSIFIDYANYLHGMEYVFDFNNDSMTTELSLPEFKGYLNDYGKCLFSITSESAGKYRSNNMKQLFTGTIGRKKVLLLLTDIYPEYNYIKGIYANIKYGQGNRLEGKFIDNNLILNEISIRYPYTLYANIAANFEGQKLIGTRTQNHKIRKEKIVLTRK